MRQVTPTITTRHDRRPEHVQRAQHRRRNPVVEQVDLDVLLVPRDQRQRTKDQDRQHEGDDLEAALDRLADSARPTTSMVVSIIIANMTIATSAGQCAPSATARTGPRWRLRVGAARPVTASAPVPWSDRRRYFSAARPSTLRVAALAIHSSSEERPGLPADRPSVRPRRCVDLDLAFLFHLLARRVLAVVPDLPVAWPAPRRTRS